MRLSFGTLVFVSLLSSYCSVSPVDDCSSMAVRLRAFRLKINCNWTTLNEKQLKEIQAPTTNVYLPVLYLVAFIVGLPSNLLALWVLVFRTKPLPSTTLLINLTVADCLLLLVLPFRIVYHFRGNHWELGEPCCRVVMAMFYGNMYGSALCLALVALDRYVALVHPFGAQTLRSRRMSVYMTVAVWVVVLAAMLPLLATQQTYVLDELQITTCHDALPEEEQENYFLPYFASLFSVCFLLPFLVVLYCHTAVLRTLLAEGRRYSHAVRVTVLVLLVFSVCLLPSNILLLLTYGDSSLDGDGEDLYVSYMVSLAVSTFNSCIDPFIFYFVSVEFREKAGGALCCHGGALCCHGDALCCQGDALCCHGDAEDQHSSLGIKVSYSSSSSGRRSQVTVLSTSSQCGTSETP